MSHEEIEDIRQDYLTCLQDLTTNSMPIIKNLTIIAQENVGAAQTITKVIEDHIRKCPPAYKLPALYLLDSICKNVGSPYTIFFGLNLYKVFTDTYTLVSEPIRRKMTELFYTWKQPSANGSSLFEKEPMKKIETFLEQAKKTQMEHLKDDMSNRQADFQSQSRQFLGNKGLSQSDLLIQVDKLLGLTQQRRTSDPNDTDAVKQIDILNQLKVVLGSQKLPDNILPGIQSTLIGFTNKEMERLSDKAKQRDPRFQDVSIPKGPAAMIKEVVPQPTQLHTQYNRPAPPQQQQQPQPQHQAIPSGPSANMPQNSLFTPQQFQQMASIMSNLSRPQNVVTNNNYGQQVPTDMNNGNQSNNSSNNQFNMRNMVQSMPYGLPGLNNNQSMPYSLSGGSVGINQPSPQISSSLINSLMSAGLLSGGEKGTAVNPLFADIELTSSSLQKPRPNLIRLLYEEMPKSCSTCGKRFPDTEEGRKAREAHLDWHFRVNKKLREESWTQMRRWYISQDEWIKYRDEEEVLGIGQAVEDEYDSDENYAPENNNSSNNNSSNRRLGIMGSGDKSGGGRYNSSGGLGSGSGIGNLNGTSNGSGGGSSNSKKSGKIDFESLKAKYVLVPANKHLASLPCPICKEKFSSVWNDDVEDWVWKNAVEVKNRIFHATCYEETERTGGDLIKRILAQQDVGVGSGSRGSTPPVATASNGNNSPASAVAALVQTQTQTQPQAQTQAPVTALLDPLANLGLPGGFDLAAILSNAKRKRPQDDDDLPLAKREKS